MTSKDFYLRYYVGHKGKFGHEFLEVYSTYILNQRFGSAEKDYGS